MPDTRRELIHLFNLKYKEVLNEDNPFPFSNCMRAMQTFRFVDEDTGEVMIEYPPEEVWKKELDGFFKDDFARDNRKFHFTYFIKQFGSFAIRLPKPVVKEKVAVIKVKCPDCPAEMEQGSVCPNELCPSHERTRKLIQETREKFNGLVNQFDTKKG